MPPPALAPMLLKTYFRMPIKPPQVKKLSIIFIEDYGISFRILNFKRFLQILNIHKLALSYLAIQNLKLFSWVDNPVVPGNVSS